MTNEKYYEGLLKENQLKLDIAIHAITNMCKSNNADEDIINAARFIVQAADNVEYYTKCLEENEE